MENEPQTLMGENGNPIINSHLNQNAEQEFSRKLASLKVLRWKFVQHKVSRVLGVYSEITDVNDKLDLVNRIYSCFLQAIEYHPQASSTGSGIGLNHQHNQYQIQVTDFLSDLDRKNAEHMVIIAVECMYEIKIYQHTLFNPLNFQIISMLEFALQYFPQSISIYAWLVKMYAKLGMGSVVTDVSESYYMKQQLDD